MYEKIPIGNLSREEWLKLRKSGIGGSDAGAICGLNLYSSPMKIFYDKTSDEVDEIDNESARQGHDLENYVAERFMEATGLKVRRSNYMFRSKEHSFMIADVDRLIVGEDAGLECKTASAYSSDKWQDGKVPLHYILQCYHYMAVTGKRSWYIAVIILGREFVYHKIEWDDEIISRLIDAEKVFWNEHVLTKIMPDPDGSKVCDEILEEYFHTAKKASVIELVGFDEKLERRDLILNQIAELQQEQNQIEQEIKLYMQDNELASNMKYRISWTNVESKRLDTKRIQQERPEIYKDFLKVSTSRRFQVKAA